MLDDSERLHCFLSVIAEIVHEMVAVDDRPASVDVSDGGGARIERYAVLSDRGQRAYRPNRPDGAYGSNDELPVEGVGGAVVRASAAVGEPGVGFDAKGASAERPDDDHRLAEAGAEDCRNGLGVLLDV